MNYMMKGDPMSIKIDVMKRDKSRGWTRAERVDYNRETRIYVHPKDETIFENLSHRRLRPYNIWRKIIIPQVLKKLDLPEDSKVRWSQRAGCSCGCSPGFILSGYHTFDVYVDVSKEEIPCSV
jgi:hypothetical protein